MLKESAQLSADEVLSELEKRHKIWKETEKKSEGLLNPTAETLDVIREFGGEILEESESLVRVAVSARYWIDTENCEHYSESGKMKYAYLFADWERGDPGEIKMRYVFPTTPYPVAVVEFTIFDGGKMIKSTELRKSRYQLQPDKVLQLLTEICSATTETRDQLGQLYEFLAQTR